ncbi:hypothetical protein HG263_19995 [Pseudoalteromonas sp. JBTF-M23]|uniref:Uncharacterized protein n=1 Tax=Pseudoalteromonas caenipelagi TaxID=2726988 RepID=A0A849VM32_9GAMM|nr:hypothetical protein [Pseudoalteromonas caenipelagi]NOU52794.1 hypothetical protein [Pseudoalteromonas caenipelagi]
MSSVDLTICLIDDDVEFVFKLDEVVLLKVPKEEVSDELLDQLYESLVKTFGIGLQLGQESVKSGSTGFSVK